MTGPSQQPADPTLTKLMFAGAGDDVRRAAVHEAGHALALARRGIEVICVSIWDSGELLSHGRWEGRTDAGDHDLPTHEVMMLALAGIAAEKAVSALAKADAEVARRFLEWIPSAAESDYVDAALIFWRDLLPGEDPPEGFLADPAVVEAIGSVWPEIVAEMTEQVDAVNEFADALLASGTRIVMPGDQATALASELTAPPVG